MILRNLIFQLEVIKQRLPAGLVSHHKQQASQCNGEQQHRWAAYNVNPAPAQASTEGLFQQTLSISLIDRALQFAQSFMHVSKKSALYNSSARAISMSFFLRADEAQSLRTSPTGR